MNSREAILINLQLADFACMRYLEDLTDAELLLRPHPGCNHTNWQIGHLILSEYGSLSTVFPGAMPALPAGFAERYSREKAVSDDPSDFLSKDELLGIYRAQRARTIELLHEQSDADLDRPSNIPYVPTVASVFSLHGSHWLMHSGQWVVVRRQLGRPALF
jgi:hypothetical protein